MQTVANQNTSVARAAASRPRRRDAVGLWLQVVTASAALVFVVVGSAWSAPLIGGTIAYVQGTEAFEIYVVEAGDSPPVRVWREEDDRIYSVKLSRDRQRVAFEAGRLGVSRQVFIVNVDGTDHRQVTNFGQGVDSAGTAWSPDGTRIAFTSNRDAVFVFDKVNGMTVAQSMDIYVMDVSAEVGVEGLGRGLTQWAALRQPTIR